MEIFFLILFLFWAGLSVAFFNLAFLKLVIWAGIALLVSFVYRRLVFIVLAIGGVVESVIAFFQFWQHKSLGLQFLGESALSPINPEIARTFLGEGQGLLLRAYGTFPHPNVLAAFLVMSLIVIYHFCLKNFTKLNFVKFGGVFVVWLGLLLTFSRAGWLVGGLATIAFLIFAYNFGFDKKILLQLASVIVISVIVIVMIFSWAILPRLDISADNFSVQERLDDYQLAKENIKTHPWLGHGLTMRMGERPIHNLYLLIASEIGLVGLLAFVLFLGSLYLGSWTYWDRVIAVLMLSSLLITGLFDHFLWTLRPGAGMLWLTVGLLLRARGSTDRT